jgi:hypothetical protein
VLNPDEAAPKDGRSLDINSNASEELRALIPWLLATDHTPSGAPATAITVCFASRRTITFVMILVSMMVKCKHFRIAGERTVMCCRSQFCSQ